MRSFRRLDGWLRTLSVLGSLVLLNLLGLGLVARLDLTRDEIYSLDPATLGGLEALDTPVTVRAYLTRDLPPPGSLIARHVRDMLEEFHARSRGRVRFEVIDPAVARTDEDRQKKREVKRDPFGNLVREMTSVERELQELGIPSFPVKVNRDDKIESMRAYLGLVVSAGGKREVLPLVQRPEELELELVSRIHKVTRAGAPKIALLAGHGAPEGQAPFEELRGLLQGLFAVVEVDLAQQPPIPDDADALLVVGPQAALPQGAIEAVARFVNSGRPAALFLGSVAVDLRTMRSRPLVHGLDGLLEAWGVRLEPGLVVDRENVPIQVTRQQGNMSISQRVNYPFIPAPRQLPAGHSVTRGLGGVAFPFASPARLVEALPDGVEGTVLIQSSSTSGVVQEPYDLDPSRRFTQEQVGALEPRGLLVTLRGRLPGLPGTAGAEDAQPARVALAGSYAGLQDGMISRGNQILVLNLLDWLLADERLLAIRTRGLQAAPLETLSDTARETLKLAHVLGLPGLLVLVGIGRWRWREARRRRARA
jgi:ABC-type uncharacterized transport system involved in gliding motility auxiliary subunit